MTKGQRINYTDARLRNKAAVHKNMTQLQFSTRDKMLTSIIAEGKAAKRAKAQQRNAMNTPVEYALIADLQFQDLGEGMKVARVTFKNGYLAVVIHTGDGYDITWSDANFADASPNVNTVLNLGHFQTNLQLREIAEL